ncbi:WxL protein peptidoglycan domain-containing protein [Micromonospora sp. CPCC 206061]|uniref:WxL protein peptidoglycan domain-containing protein n=1 Tax=Micromonospora sp. CPCC 206061 TaxID=3122410 RepID=UPI002FF164E9
MIRSSFATLAAVLVAVPFAPARALADPTPTGPPNKPTLTWAVQPANQQGPDGRRWIAHTLDPGQVVTERLAVRNFSNRAAVFALKAADGYLTDNGRFNMLPSDKASVDGGTWIQVQDKVNVGANETKVVPFTITVPRDAKPGDHPAGIAATVTATGGTVAVESRVGFRVMMRISGTVTAALTVDDLTATYRHSWNPFAAGSIRVRYTTRNDGSVAVTGTGRVATAELGGLTTSDARARVEQTLPGGSRQVDVRVAGVWGLAPLRTTVDLTPAVLDGDTSGAEIRPASAAVTVWTLPWPQLLLMAVFVAAVLGARTISRRRRQRLAQLLARARDEGRAEARDMSEKVS